MSGLPWPTHPAADLFPMLEGAELDELAADIKAHGLTEPVWLYNDPDAGTVLLDGRNRARACDLVDVPVRTRRYTGDNPVAFSVSQNLMRRHLTDGQRAFIGRDLEPLFAAQAAKRKAQAPGAPRGTKQSSLEADLPQETGKRAAQARDEAAEVAGTSGRAVGQAKRIEETRPDLAEKVRAGTMALDRAERIIRDEEAQARKVAEAQAAAAAAPILPTVDLREGDFREVLADLTGIDAIITDPPYPGEYLPLLADLAAWADKVLVDGGVLAVLIGQTHLPEVYRLLDGGRPYRWTCAYLTAGAGYVSHPRKIQSNWKPLLIYGGGPRIADVVNSEGTDAAAKSHHKWGQDYGAFHTIVDRLTKPGQTVADPFMGSGTTLLAARALGRHVVGADIDPAAVATAKGRLT